MAPRKPTPPRKKGKVAADPKSPPPPVEDAEEASAEEETESEGEEEKEEKETVVEAADKEDDESEAEETYVQADATRLYLKEIGFSPLLTAEEEVFFARKAQKGDAAARRRMIESNLRLVGKIARRYMNRGLGLLDLIRGRILARIGINLDESMSARIYQTIIRLPALVGLRNDSAAPMRDLDTVRAFLGGIGPVALFDLPWMPICSRTSRCRRARVWFHRQNHFRLW